MSVSIRIIRKGKPLKQVLIESKNSEKLLAQQVKQLGMETEAKINAIIQQNKKRPGGNNKLEQSMTLEYFGDGISWGVGNISYLNAMVPYWKAVNWGSAHIIGLQVPMGGFTPGESKPSAGSFRAGRWQPGTNEYSFTSKKPIPAMNYIEKTIFWFRTRIATLVGGRR